MTPKPTPGGPGTPPNQGSSADIQHKAGFFNAHRKGGLPPVLLPEAPPACVTCAAFKPYASGPCGECRRHAPRALAAEGNPAYSVWPTVDGTDWCLEYLPRA